MAAGLDVHDGGSLYLDLENPAELVAFYKVRQLPPGCFTTVPCLPGFADAPAPYDSRREILQAFPDQTDALGDLIEPDHNPRVVIAVCTADRHKTELSGTLDG